MKTLYESILDDDAMDKADNWAKERVELFAKWKKIIDELDTWSYDQLVKFSHDTAHGEVSRSLKYQERPLAPSDYKYSIGHKIKLSNITYDELIGLKLGALKRQFQTKTKQLYKSYLNGNTKANLFPTGPEYKYDVDWEVEVIDPNRKRDLQMGSLVVKGLAKFASECAVIISLHQPVDKPNDFVNHKQLL